jgi:hypothetical protein
MPDIPEFTFAYPV